MTQTQQLIEIVSGALPYLGTAAAGLLLYKSLFRSSTALPDPTAHLDRLNRPLRVAITGGSKGLGLALARKFLSAHSATRVAICSRSKDAVEAAQATLESEVPSAKGRVFATHCDVADPKSVADFVRSSAEALGGGIDVFIANAGQVFVPRSNLADLEDPRPIVEVVNANLTGAVLCAREALRLMRGQPEGGVVWFVDGDGSRGNPTVGNCCYGATKYALVNLTKTLSVECQGTNLGVHIFSPGVMADTSLLQTAVTRPAKDDGLKVLERKVWILNAISETSDHAAGFLYPHVVAAYPKPAVDNKKRGYFRYPKVLTVATLIWKLLAARFTKQYEGKFFRVNKEAMKAEPVGN